jgi:hypothetical protein
MSWEEIERLLNDYREAVRRHARLDIYAAPPSPWGPAATRRAGRRGLERRGLLACQERCFGTCPVSITRRKGPTMKKSSAIIDEKNYTVVAPYGYRKPGMFREEALDHAARLLGDLRAEGFAGAVVCVLYRDGSEVWRGGAP